MQEKVVLFKPRTRPVGPPVCPAQFYKFHGETSEVTVSECFLEKAAAFQEIRDCLVAADHNKLSPHEAERRIRYFLDVYLNAH